MIQERLVILLGGLAVVAAAARSWWLSGEARAIAESWLHAHHYKVRKLDHGGLSFFRFPTQFFRNDDAAYRFRAVVEDKQLGGTGIVWLRVWTDRRGLIEREPDVSWERLPSPLADTPAQPEEKWEQAQRALLRRIARGTSSFSAPRREAPDDMPFDELIEHLLAMQNRGLIACSTPVKSRRPGARYDMIEFVDLTDAGRAYLDSIPG
jgi:hypothetical protein